MSKLVEAPLSVIPKLSNLFSLKLGKNKVQVQAVWLPVDRLE